MSSLLERIAARYLEADLTPPLGKPGGPEHIEDRIKKHVTDPHLEQHLVNEVEHGVDLSNEEAAKVYPLGTEPGVGPVRQFLLGPHASYRMDLRSITVEQLRDALKMFVKEYQDGKSRKSWESEQWTKALKAGEKIEYEAPNHLFVVFTAPRPDQVKIVTTYWKGKSDPKPQKHAGYREPAGELSGYRTYVENPDGTAKKEPKPGENEEKHQVLPSPQNSRKMDLGQGNMSINGPGGSGSAADGRSLHKDKVRTPGTPGSEPPLDNPSQNSPQSRKPNMQASRKADDMIRREPPESTPGQHFDRASPNQQWPHHPSQSGFDTDVAVPDNPGSAKVIPDNKDFVNHKDRVAARISEILDGCDKGLHSRAQGLPVQLTRVSPTHMWTFNVKGKTGTYKVRLKAFPKGNATSITKMDVKMSCSCPYWRWQGPEHHAVVGDYQYGRPVGTASVPVIKDPAGVHHACKHMIAVLQDVMNLQVQRKSPKVQKLARILEDNASIERVAGRYYRAMRAGGRAVLSSDASEVRLMPTYAYACSESHEFEKVLRITECDVPQICDQCGKTGKKIITGTSFVLKGDNWPGKSIKLRGQMARKNARLDRKQAERAPSATLAPNVGGERVDTWAEAQKLAASQGKDTSSYEPLVAKEQAKT